MKAACLLAVVFASYAFRQNPKEQPPLLVLAVTFVLAVSVLHRVA